MIYNSMITVAATVILTALQPATPPYKNPSLPVDQRVADLLSRMTLEEKVAQTLGLWQKKAEFTGPDGKFAPGQASGALRYGIGQITRPGERKGPREMVEYINAIQRWVMEHTRLAIPVMYHEEALHGHAARKGTHYPQAIALASTWDPALVEEVFETVAKEVRARGAQQVLMPVLDLARDPRWGRVEETYGEDPYLVAQIGMACIRGLQGPGLPLDAEHVMATAKHFAAHGQPEAGVNSAPANYSERVLREQFLYPFRAAFVEAKIASVMPSYNEIDGSPSHANRWLMQRVLREEWGFQGFAVSDYRGIEELFTLHRVAGSLEEAARMALEAGVDLELPDPSAYPTLAAQVRDGRVSMAALDRAVARILRAKFLAGLFEHPYADADRAERVTNSAEHRKLALRSAQKAIVLLKNERGVLPLDRTRIKTLAVIGPNANRRLLGGYSDDPGYFVTVLDGVKEKLGATVRVAYAEGCQISAPGSNWNSDEVNKPDAAQDEMRMQEALKAAAGADTILLVLGGDDATSREAYAANHLGDMDTLDLLGRQNELAEKILAMGKPVAVVLLNGRPHSINLLAEKAPAILEGWYLGQETGHAVADVVFGDSNPGGRLPVSLARSAGQVPIFYNYKPSAKRGYLWADKEPLYPFGHGLSYTQFRYANLRVSPAAAPATAERTVTVEVTNTGGRDGDEVVQLYLRDDVSSLTRPIKELRGFERIALRRGDTKTVTFRIGPEHLMFLDSNMNWVVEAGTFTAMVGGSSKTALETKFEVTGVSVALQNLRP